MRDLIFVVAGNHREYLEYVRHSNGRFRYRMVVSTETIRGFRGGHYVRIGTWMDRDDIGYIMFQLHASECIELAADTNRANTTPHIDLEAKDESELKTEDDKYFYRIGYHHGKEKCM